MSKVAIAGNASGTGTFTIAAPNSNTDRTLTLPDEAGTVLTSASETVLPKGGPAFSAYQSSGQSVSAATVTKVQFQTEEFDTANCFDNSTNYRFTPNVAGYYSVSGGISASASGFIDLYVYKNGANLKHTYTNYNSPSFGAYGSTVLVYLNGSTDYIEFYYYNSSASTLSTGAPNTYFQAFLVRAA